MRFRLTIGRRIVMGFGLFIFFALLVVLLTNRTLERSRSINAQINSVYGPSVDALVRLRNLVQSAQMLIKYWAVTESIPDAPEKTALITLTEKELPALLDRIDTLSAGWDKEEVALLNRCFDEMDQLFTLERRVREILPELSSYKDPLVWIERNELAEEGGPLDQRTGLLLADVDKLLSLQEAKRQNLSGGMIRSFDSLKFFVLYLGSGLVIVGIVVAILIVRSIVAPVQRLRGVLLSLGRGVFPATRIHAHNDEVGDMSRALMGLIDGLKRTTEFSHAVAAGDFKAEYQPLSEEDVLGHALLKMRTELGERERVLETKVKERTEEVILPFPGKMAA